MKRIISILITLIVLGAIVWGISFAWKNLRGVRPAIQKAPQDITQELPKGNEQPTNKTDLPLKLPEGFSVSIFAKDLKNARVLARDNNNVLVVSLTSEGKVVALPDRNNDGAADENKVIVSGLNKPHGLAFDCSAANGCKLYVGETDKIDVFDYDGKTFEVSNRKIIAQLPGGGNHFTRTLGIGPDDKLYVSIGSDCNVCNEKDERRASIYVMNLDGSDFHQFAKGLRNSVFFTWSPIDGNMWATEMGRDLLGDNTPPDEINIIKGGGNYGWPICYGQNTHDTNFDKNVYIRNPCEEPLESPSHIDIPAHSAPLGLTFIPQDGWPEGYGNDLLVAYHGSWNRSTPTGYKIVRIKLDGKGNSQGIEDFLTGWLTGKGALGRPVDLLALPVGTLYVSDDKAGVIYLVRYVAK